MYLARRDFLKLLGLTAGAAGLGGCNRLWSVPDRLVEQALRGPGIESHLQTICGLCEGGCGLTVRLVDNLPVGLKGNPRHPLNRGGLCPVGQAGLEVLYAPERLQGPLRRGADGAHRPVSWDEALAELADRLRALRETNAGHKVALLTEEPSTVLYQLARRFTHALGSANVAGTSSPGSLAYALMQGIDEPPAFDLAYSDLVLSFGLDVYEDGSAPVHAIAAMVGSRPTDRRCELIHVGTRLSPSGAHADQHVPVEPGTDAALALGIGHVLVREGIYDRRFVAEHTFGFDDWTDADGNRRLGFRRLLMERFYPDRAAQLCGSRPDRIVDLARRFASAAAPVAIAGGAALQGSNATWTAMAVHALNALVGGFDRRGGVVLPPPIPLTPLAPLPGGEPDADRSLFAPAAGSGRFGRDAVEALCESIREGSHELDVLIILNSNPVHSSPLGGRLRQALDRIPMVVALSPFRDETAAAADLILPTHVFLESWQESTTPAGVAVSVLGLGRPVVEPLFDTRHPGDVLLELGRRIDPALATAALPWPGYIDYVKHRLEGLVTSGQGSVISGSFEASWVHFLEERGWRFLEQSQLDDFWEDLARESGWWNPVRVTGDWGRTFRTPSGRFEFFSLTLERHLRALGAGEGGEKARGEEALRRGCAALAMEARDDAACLPHYEPPQLIGKGEATLVPFRTMTGRGRHAAASPMLMEMFGYPVLSGWQTWAELAPETAHELGIGDGDHVAIESDRASIEAVARVQPGATPGTVHVPLGLGHRHAGGADGDIGSNPVEVMPPSRDPLSGTLSLASTRVHVRLLRRRPHGGPAPVDGGHA